MKVKSLSRVRLFVTPWAVAWMGCSLPGSSVHGIYQAIVLEWIAISFSREEYTEELYKKDIHDPDNHNGVIFHLEPDILECEVKWTLGSKL